MLFPGAVHEGEDAVIEKIEKIAKAVVLFLGALNDQFRITGGEHAYGSGKPHEINRHLYRDIGGLRPMHGLNFAGRKIKGRVGNEAHGLVSGPRKISHRLALGQEPPHQPDRLKKADTERLMLQEIQQGRVEGGVSGLGGIVLGSNFIFDEAAGNRSFYSKTRLPARGGHSLRTSLLWFVDATN